MSHENNYKATFILDTRDYQEPVENLVEKLKGIMESIGGNVKEVEHLGQKEFVRVTDRKFTAGIYVQYDVSGPATLPAELNNKIRLDKTVNRVLIESVN